MKVIVAGSRTIDNTVLVAEAMAAFEERYGNISEVVSGTARGPDRIGESVAETWGVPVKRMAADWDRYGKAAGFKRNYDMAQYADGLVAVWDGKSNGTANMISWACVFGLYIHVEQIKV